MTRWLLLLVVGLGALGLWTGYLGRLLVASTLVSVVIVAFALYLFLKYWPEEEKLRSKRDTARAEPVARSAKVPVTSLNGPPRARFKMALKQVVRKQDVFRLSPQGAQSDLHGPSGICSANSTEFHIPHNRYLKIV